MILHNIVRLVSLLRKAKSVATFYPGINITCEWDHLFMLVIYSECVRKTLVKHQVVSNSNRKFADYLFSHIPSQCLCLPRVNSFIGIALGLSYGRF